MWLAMRVLSVFGTALQEQQGAYSLTRMISQERAKMHSRRVYGVQANWLKSSEGFNTKLGSCIRAGQLGH